MPRLEFEESVERALLLIRKFRLHCVAQQLEPRAVRLALKYMLLTDSHFALKALFPEEEEQLDRLAHEMLKQAIENEKKVKG